MAAVPLQKNWRRDSAQQAEHTVDAADVLPREWRRVDIAAHDSQSEQEITEAIAIDRPRHQPLYRARADVGPAPQRHVARLAVDESLAGDEDDVVERVAGTPSAACLDPTPVPAWLEAFADIPRRDCRGDRELGRAIVRFQPPLRREATQRPCALPRLR